MPKVVLDKTIRLDFLFYVVITIITAISLFFKVQERVSNLETWKTEHMIWSGDIRQNIDEQLKELKQLAKEDRLASQQLFYALNARLNEWEKRYPGVKTNEKTN